MTELQEYGLDVFDLLVMSDQEVIDHCQRIDDRSLSWLIQYRLNECEELVRIALDTGDGLRDLHKIITNVINTIKGGTWQTRSNSPT